MCRTASGQFKIFSVNTINSSCPLCLSGILLIISIYQCRQTRLGVLKFIQLFLPLFVMFLSFTFCLVKEGVLNSEEDSKGWEPNYHEALE